MTSQRTENVALAGHAAGRLAGVCLDLFDATGHLHGLTATARPLIEPLCLLKAAPAPLGGDADLVPDGLPVSPALTPYERRTLAAALEFSAPGVATSDVLRQLRSNPSDTARGSGARLAALLRIGVGLECPATSCRPLAVLDSGEALTLLVTKGKGVRSAVRAALRGAELWNALCGRPVHFMRSAAIVSARPYVSPPDSMCAAGLRVLRREVEQFVSREYGLADSHDPEFVHEMRIAIRRMRAACRVFRDDLSPDVDSLKASLSWISDVLGDARDADVFITFLKGYATRAAEPDRAFIEPFIRNEERRRRRYYAAVEELLNSKRYRDFRRQLEATAGTTLGHDPGRAASPEVGARAPEALRRCLRKTTRHPADLGSYVPEALHDLRIACKRLRYTAEFFASVYPDGLRKIAASAKSLQSLLGAVHDADVYADRIRVHARRRAARGWRFNSAVRRLNDDLRDWRTQSLRRAAAEWKGFTRPRRVRRDLATIATPEAAVPRSRGARLIWRADA